MKGDVKSSMKIMLLLGILNRNLLKNLSSDFLPEIEQNKGSIEKARDALFLIEEVRKKYICQLQKI